MEGADFRAGVYSFKGYVFVDKIATFMTFLFG